MTDDDDGRLPDTDPLEQDFETKDWSVEPPEKLKNLKRFVKSKRILRQGATNLVLTKKSPS